MPTFATFCNRLDDLISYIEQHPEEWDQKEWCGTACCLAGHAYLCSKGRPPLTEDYERDVITICNTAKEYLGLNSDETAYLFRGWRNLDDFKHFSKKRRLLRKPLFYHQIYSIMGSC